VSFPRYPKYKESGVEWLGEVPEHWKVCLLKRAFRSVDYGISESLDGEGAVAILRMGNIENGKIITDDLKYTKSVQPLLLLKRGDLLYNRTNSLDLIGKVGMFLGNEELPISFASYLVRLRTVAESLPGFFAYLLNTDGILGIARSNAFVAIGQCNLNPTRYGQITVAIPPLAEQSLIIAFLDRETAKIDGLVGEQRRLMELLKEKRQAVISHAVTKGLNPHAPMKPSGIEWLGDVPNHWTATPVKYVATVGNGSTPSREIPEYWAETGFPWLNSSVVNSAFVTEAEGFVTERALQECHLPIVAPPAVLVGITGQGRTRGMAAMLGIKATINQHVAYVKPNTVKLDVQFLLRAFEMAYVKLRRDSEEAGATKGAITCEQIGNLHIPFPPLSEQVTIVGFLNSEIAKFDLLTAEARRAIDLLQERRTALISAAVTGKIDVRGISEGAGMRGAGAGKREEAA